LNLEMINSAKKTKRPLLKRGTPVSSGKRKPKNLGATRNADLSNFITFEANWNEQPVNQRNIIHRRDSLVDVMLDDNEDEKKLTEALRTPKKLRFDDINKEERDSDLLVNTQADEGYPFHDIFFDEEAQCICEESIYFKANHERREFGKRRIRRLREIYSNVDELNLEIRRKLGHISAYAWICAAICLASLIDMITSLEDYGEIHLRSWRFEVEIMLLLSGSALFTVLQVIMSNRMIALEKGITGRLREFEGDGVFYRLQKVESLCGRNGYKYRLQVTLQNAQQLKNLSKPIF